jgi:hypothetical protein
METFIKYISIAVVVLLLLLGITTLFAWFVQLLVNYLFTPATLTAVFGMAKLTLWRAWCLSFLSSLLFKSFSTSSSK